MCRTPTKQSNEPILGDEADTLVSAADTLIASTLVGGSPGRSSPLASLQPSPSHQNRSPGLQRLRSSYDLDAASQCGSEMTEGVIDLKITGSTSQQILESLKSKVSPTAFLGGLKLGRTTKGMKHYTTNGKLNETDVGLLRDFTDQVVPIFTSL